MCCAASRIVCASIISRRYFVNAGSTSSLSTAAILPCSIMYFGSLSSTWLVKQRHLSRIRRCMTRSSAGSTSRSDGQCVHNSCFKRFTIDISWNIATLCILQFFYNFLYRIGIEVRQIQVYVIQSFIDLNMHLHRSTDHSPQKLCNIGCIRRMAERHHRFCSRTIPSG